jgi:hypothetical protein
MKPKLLVTWFNSSYVHTKRLRELQKKANARIKVTESDYIEHVYVLCQENDTRWNSWYLSVKRIILLWPEIKMVLSEYKCTYLMSDNDIKVLEEHVKLFEPFYESTLTLEREGSTLSEIICELVGLNNHLTEWTTHSEYTNTDVCAIEMNMKIDQLLEEYYSCDFIIAAVILDRTLGTNWKKLIPEHLRETGLNYIKTQLAKLDPDWNKKDSNSQDSTTTPTKTTSQSLGKSYRQTSEVAVEAKSELDLYFASDLPTQRQSILEWWCEKRNVEKMPNLSIIAQRIFTIPGSAAISERTWSTVRLIWSILWNRLEPETVEMLTILRSNSDMW